MYNFEKKIDRRGTASRKWDCLVERYGNDDVLPLWIADMDFQAPPDVVEEITNRSMHGVYGYTIFTDEYYQSFVDWAKRRYDWNLSKESIYFSPGVITALCLLINAITVPKEKIMVLTPVYYPFLDIITKNNRTLVECPLINTGSNYEMNFELIDEMTKDTKLLIFCNPHNPVGRVWTYEELKRLSKICIKNNVTIISDDVHCDIIYNKNKYTPISTISHEIAMRTITCMAPSKTFNLAGLKTSLILINSPNLSALYTEMLEKFSIKTTNVFGELALKKAYQKGEDWLDNLCEYLFSNIIYFRDELLRIIPDIKCYVPEGTYLLWVDFSSTGIDNPYEFLVENAKVAPSKGADFSLFGHESYVRFNIATPKSVLEEAIVRIENAIKNNVI